MLIMMLSDMLVLGEHFWYPLVYADRVLVVHWTKRRRFQIRSAPTFLWSLLTYIIQPLQIYGLLLLLKLVGHISVLGKFVQFHLFFFIESLRLEVISANEVNFFHKRFLVLRLGSVLPDLNFLINGRKSINFLCDRMLVILEPSIHLVFNRIELFLSNQFLFSELF